MPKDNAMALLRRDDSLWKLYTLEGEEYPVDKHGRREYVAPDGRGDRAGGGRGEGTKEKEGRSGVEMEGASEEGGIDIRRPVASEYLAKNGFVPEYPNGKDFAVVLTHDIDIIQPSMVRDVISSGRHVLGGKLGRSFHQLTWRMRKKRSPYMNFQEILEVEGRYDASSSFFFIAHPRDHTGAGYPLEGLDEHMAGILDAGCEIGLHGSYYACESLEAIREEKKEVEKHCGRKVVGYRNHFLRIDIPSTWRYLRDAGFLYDATLGFANHCGFRNGMAHPHRPFDVENSESIELLELPLNFMDNTLYGYMGLTPQEGLDTIKESMDGLAPIGGAVTLLWHNDTFSNPQFKEWAKVYEKALEYAHKNNGWLCTGKELCEWWKKNGF
ncbi:MAG: polysaccharide deacetylase family protein [Thermoplasmata archaeon]|nr:polysaccharide deacetylase family protein [Thermoplasmata archaeon]